MVTITRNLRRILIPSHEEQENLDEFRKRTRAALNRPFEFEATTARPWEVANTDPWHGFFKPFSLVKSTTDTETADLTKAGVKRELTDFSFRRVAIPISVGLITLAGILVWQTLAIFSTYQGVVTPIPFPIQAKQTAQATSATSAEEQVVPAGTSLQPGGPYTGTGGPEPAPLDPAVNSSNTITTPSGSGGTSTTNLTGSVQLLPTTDITLPTLP